MPDTKHSEFLHACPGEKFILSESVNLGQVVEHIRIDGETPDGNNALEIRTGKLVRIEKNTRVIWLD